MDIQRNYSLRLLNTFGIDVKAALYADIHSGDELKTLLTDPEFSSLPKMVLGGGSNILFTGDFEGLVIRNSIKGIETIRENQDHAWVRVGAGEVWHHFVVKMIEQNYAGLENLSLIPGCVGASPIQNIGAYGVELKDVFFELEAMNFYDGSLRKFSASDCQFGYRDSIFKREMKNQYVIVSVTFCLNKHPVFHTGYGAIEQELQAMAVHEPDIRSISQAVINIRQSKLPDPALIGNAGSFFKNPEISLKKFDSLKNKYPELTGYKTGTGTMKIPAGWLIEQCGWKGKVIGRVGMHKQQALVLVNYGGATGTELVEHARKVQQSVADQFGIKLEMEVNIL